MTAHFNFEVTQYWQNLCCSNLTFGGKLAYFDARAFNLSKEEVVNYFIWRQQDASRNSVQMLGSAYFSVSELHGKNNKQVQEMLLLQKNINWNDLPTWQKRGTCIKYFSNAVDDNGIQKYDNGYIMDEEIPIFTSDRDYIGIVFNANIIFIIVKTFIFTAQNFQKNLFLLTLSIF
jgi:tRNA(His) 5'-end guanylyltransferase